MERASLGIDVAAQRLVRCHSLQCTGVCGCEIVTCLCVALCCFPIAQVSSCHGLVALIAELKLHLCEMPAPTPSAPLASASADTAPAPSGDVDMEAAA